MPKGKPTALKHGVHSKMAQGRFGDARTKDYREIETALDRIAGDYGGRSEMSGAQLTLLDSIRPMLIVLIQVGRFVGKRAEVVDEKGNLLPVLDKNFLTYCESIRRHIQAIHELGKKRPTRAPDLTAYIQENYGPEAAGKDGKS